MSSTPRQDALLQCFCRSNNEHCLHTPACQVLNIAAMRALVPRIDVADPTYGTAPPAYAITPSFKLMGTEYLFMGIGAGVIGVFSLATGAEQCV